MIALNPLCFLGRIEPFWLYKHHSLFERGVWVSLGETLEYENVL